MNFRTRWRAGGNRECEAGRAPAGSGRPSTATAVARDSCGGPETLIVPNAHAEPEYPRPLHYRLCLVHSTSCSMAEKLASQTGERDERPMFQPARMVRGRQ